MQAHADTTSLAPGSVITFSFTRPCPPGGRAVRIVDATTDELRATATATGATWGWTVPADLPSSLYRAEFPDTGEPGTDEPDAGGADGGEAVWFVVRGRPGPAAPRVLVVVPFLTWQAYNRLGEPGAGLYLSEQPDRAHRVSFDRPGGGPAGFWEDRFYRWLRTEGYAVDFCSGVDVHDGAARLADYDLFVSAGHDEYWTWEMRDAVESFLDGGGNVAFFGANTSWWQARLEDDGRTMVCYRDAVADPVAATDPRRTTVEWHAAPASRPENAMTGLSYRSGAGCWEKMEIMPSYGYRVRFAGHWVFAGTGLRDGDEFAFGALGYETDAAEYQDVGGVPLATGRDGAPGSLVILATADLTGWRAHGQGGHATMAVFRRGPGTVFNAATVNWGNRLDDPVVARITRTVLDRLSVPRCGAGWEDIGPGAGVVALAAEAATLFGVTGDGRLLRRRLHGQNLGWTPVLTGPRLRALSCSRESHHGRPVELYGLAEDGWVLARPPSAGADEWQRLCPAVPGTVALTALYKGLFAADEAGGLWHLGLDEAAAGAGWKPCGAAGPVRALAGLGGRLFALGLDGILRTRTGEPAPASWSGLGTAGDAVTLTAHAGRLITGSADRLSWREVTGHGVG